MEPLVALWNRLVCHNCRWWSCLCSWRIFCGLLAHLGIAASADSIQRRRSCTASYSWLADWPLHDVTWYRHEIASRLLRHSLLLASLYQSKHSSQLHQVLLCYMTAVVVMHTGRYCIYVRWNYVRPIALHMSRSIAQSGCPHCRTRNAHCKLWIRSLHRSPDCKGRAQEFPGMKVDCGLLVWLERGKIFFFFYTDNRRLSVQGQPRQIFSCLESAIHRIIVDV